MLAFFEEYAIFFIIFLLMLLIGMYIARKEREKAADKSADFRKALEIETDHDFAYGIETNIGYAFVYGIIRAINPIKPSWCDNELLSYEIIEEELQERVDYVPVTEYDDDHMSHTRMERHVYYEWVMIGKENQNVDEIEFRGKVLPYNKIKMPDCYLLKRENTGFNRRNSYYILKNNLAGSIFTFLSENGISDKSRFFSGLNSKAAKIKAIKDEQNRVKQFWILWLLITIAVFMVTALIKYKLIV